MKKQIFSPDAKKAADLWKKRLYEKLQEKGYTQTKFINELNKKYGTQFTQAMISDWLHVGETPKRNDGTQRCIGFPVYTNMMLIADLLGVNVGYLTGETDMELFTIEKASNYTNLSEAAINSILKITNTGRSRICLEKNSEKYKSVLNKLLASPRFAGLINALVDMEVACDEKRKINQPLETLHNELGEELFDTASKYHDSCSEDLESLDLTEEEIEAIKRFRDASDAGDSIAQKCEYDIKVCKYSVQEAFTLMINQLYSDNK